MPRLYHAAKQQSTVTQLSLFEPFNEATDIVLQQVHKSCSKCKEIKPLDAFYPLVTGKFGRSSDCRVCRNAANRARTSARKACLPATKVCVTCGVEKPSSDFPQRKNHPVRCKVCRSKARNVYDQEYRDAHKDQAQRRSRKHYLQNRDKVLARTHAYYAERKDQYYGYWLKRKHDPQDRARRNHRARVYRNSPHRIEITRAYNREYLHKTRAGNPKWQEYNRQRYHIPQNREKHLAYFRQRGAKPEFKEYRRRYRASHPEQDVANNFYRREMRRIDPSYAYKNRERSRRRSAIKKQRSVEKVNYQRIIERDNNICHICGQEVRSHHTVHFDHVIPLIRYGGSHTEENIKVAHSVCNLRKGQRLMSELSDADRRGPDVA